MVFEGLVADVLSKVLGDYVKNLNKDQLKIGIFGGNVVLNNLELKSEALASLNLPISVVKGFLGKLELHVPWKNLKSQPVIVHLDNIFLLAGPQTQSFKYDEEEEEKKTIEEKKKKLANYELMKTFKAETGKKDAKEDSFTNKLVTKIIDNLQIVINKIHVRYEDSKEGQTFALGITLNKLAAQSTDEFWKPAFLDIATNATRHKLAEMNDLSVYLDPNTKSLQGLSTQEMGDVFLKLIPSTGASGVSHSFLIHPLSASLKLKMNKNEQMDKAIPKIVIDCVFNELALALSEPQFHDILQLLQLVNNYARDIKYLKYRPTVALKKDPRAWWKYAYEVALADIRQRRERMSWTYILARRKKRLEYIALYKRKQGVKWLKELKKEEDLWMSQLEDDLSFEDIVYFRSLADAELKTEAENYQQKLDYEKSKGLGKNKGFFTSLFSKGPTEEEKKAMEAAPRIELTDSQRDEIYKTIGYDEVVSEVEMPKDYVENVANLEVKAISFQLVSTKAGKTLLHGVFDRISVQAKTRKDAVAVEAGIQSFTVTDKGNENTLFPQLIAPSKGSGSTQFCKFKFETAPLDGHADAVVDLRMAPLDVVVHRPLLVSVTDFFKMDQDVDLSGLQNQANARLESLRQMTKTQLQQAVETHKTMDLFVDIRAPTLIVAESVSKKETTILVADLGNFTVKSQLTPKSPGDKTYTEEDAYDKFTLTMSHTKLLIASNDQNWRDPEVQVRQNLHLIEDFDINLLLKQSIQPDNLSLTTIKVSGELPSLQMRISAEKYNRIMDLVDVITGGPSAAPLPPAETQAITTGATNEPVVLDAEALKAQKKKELSPEHQKLVIAHKQVEASFKIVNVSVALSRTVSGVESNIVKLNVSNVVASFSQRSYDMTASVVLQKIEIEDCQEQTPEFKYLATSHFGDHNDQEALISIAFTQTQRESPEYAKIDSSVNFVFNSFFFICNAPTITALLEFTTKISRPPPATAAITTLESPRAKETAVTTTTAPGAHVPHVAQPKHKRKKSEIVKMKVAAKINTLGVVLTEHGKKLAQFSIVGTQADVTMKENSMVVEGALATMQLLDCTAGADGLYKKVITPRDESTHMLNFKFETFSALEEGYPGWDAEVHLLLRAIRVNAVMGYLMHLQNYAMGMLAPIMNAPPAAPAPLAVPSTTDAPASPRKTQQLTQAPAQAQQPVQRMKLDVKMESPAIVVPESPTSLNTIVVELGTLSVQNGFQTSPTDDLPLDVMCCQLTSMNIKSVHGGTSENQILEKVNLEVEIIRVLTVQEKIPQQKLTVRISTVEFVLSEEEYKFLWGMMNSITAQLAAVAQQAPAQPVPQVAQTPTEPGVTSKGMVYTGVTQMEVGLALEMVRFEILHGDGKAATDSIASFEIAQIGLALQMSSENMMKMDATIKSISLFDTRPNTDSKFPDLLGYRPGSAANPPPQITLGYLRNNVSGAQSINLILNRPALFVSPSPVFAIKDFFMLVFPPEPTPEQKAEEERKKRREERKSLPRTPSGEEKKENRQSLTPRGDDEKRENRKSLTPRGEEEKTEHRKSLSRTPSGEEKEKRKSITHRKSNPPPLQLPVGGSLATPPSQSPRASTAVAAPAPLGPPIEATITINNPEILLVENEKEADTRAMVVKTSVNVKYSRDSSGNETAAVDLVKLKMYVFQPSAENTTQKAIRPIPVLNPFNLSVNYSRTPRPGSTVMKQNIGIKLQPLELFVSYQDFKLVMAILNNSMPQQPQAAAPVENPGHPATAGPVDPHSMPAGSPIMLDQSVSMGQLPTLPAKVDDDAINAEQLQLEGGSVCVTFINDLNGRNTPFAELRLADLSVDLRGWSSMMQLTTTMTVTMDYFNASLNIFEPMLEYWTFALQVKFGADPKMHIKLHSDQFLNLNVSHALIDTLSSTYQVLSSDYYSKDKKSRSPRLTSSTSSPATPHVAPLSLATPSPPTSASLAPRHPHSASSSPAISLRDLYTPTRFHPYWIMNMTGVPMEYMLETEPTMEEEPALDESGGIPPPSPKEETKIYPIEQGQKGYVSMGQHHKVRNFRQIQTRGSQVSIRFAGGASPLEFVKGVPLDLVGVHPLEINGKKLLAEVAWNDDGSKLLTIRTGVLLFNHTTVPLWARIEANSKQVTLPMIDPGKSTPVPLGFTDGKVWIRPDDQKYVWTRDEDAITFTQLADLEEFSKKVHVLRCPQEKDIKSDNESFRSVLHVTKTMDFKGQKEVQVELGFYPPVVVENLLPLPINTYVINQNRNQPTVTVTDGETLPLYYVDPNKTISITIMGIQGFTDAPHTLIDFEKDKEGKISKRLVLREHNSKRTLTIRVDYREEVPGSRIFTLFVPYWLINHSQMTLHYRNPEEKSEECVAIVKSDDTDTALPFMYSEDKISVKSSNSHWSKDFSIQTVGTAGALELQDHNTPTVYEFKVHISLAWDKFKRTKVVTFVPRFVMVNHMAKPLRLKQKAKRKYEKEAPGISHATPEKGEEKEEKKKGGFHLFGGHKSSKEKEEEKEKKRPELPEDKIFKLQPNEVMAFHWPNGKRKNKLLRIQLDEGDQYNWSGGFLLDQVAEHVIKMRNAKNNGPDNLSRVDISDSDFSTFITFRDEDKETPPFRIENDTPLNLYFAQRKKDKLPEKFGEEDFTDKLGPKSSFNYALDDPTSATNLIACFENDYRATKSYNISKIKSFKPITVQVLGSDYNMTQTDQIFAFVWVSGATRVLCFTMNKMRYQRYLRHMDAEQQGENELNVVLSLAGVGISVVDKTPKELIYWSLSKISVELNQSTKEDSLEVILGDMQIDNQLYASEFPVLLQSTNKDEEKPFFHASIIKSKSAATIAYFRYFSVLVQEMAAQVEDGLLLALLNFYTSLPLQRFQQSPETPTDLALRYYKYKFEAPSTSPVASQMTYFKLLLLNPIKVNFTFSLAREGFLHSNNALFVFLESVGLSLAKLENAPICLNALMLEHPFCSWNTLTSRIVKHYTIQAINQVYKVFGSVDMLGNPVGLFNNLGTGVVDFFYEPAQGLVKSPKDFGVGLAKGTTSLVKNTVYGTFNTLTKITGTLGKGIATLSMDDKYLAERNSAQRKKPKHAGEGVVMGLQGLGKGIFDGVTGIVRKPVEGAMKDGVGGFAKGVAQGFIGVAVKPVAGVLDLTTRTTEGIRNTTNLVTDKPRVRPPRQFYPNKALKEFSQQEAEGTLLLNTVRKGKYSTDAYVFHAKTTKSHSAILTDKRLVDVKKKHTSFGWQVMYNNITSINLAKEGLVLNVDPPQVLKVLEGAKKTILLKVDDESVAMQLFVKLGACIKSAKASSSENALANSSSSEKSDKSDKSSK